ncbi:hypothetical protein Glove_221g79 [Diversispora epigaea]|uniref:Protein kinase domain-containing protein n=1 Tax=Diversispora epigaea TaxID=1348612 RepID=A0A397IK59_9GLOM|nr:hypothetical protein Glove_221g79 [Diversispora epigaea]
MIDTITIKGFDYNAFENITRVASGAFGTVYCTNSGRLVALKSLHKKDELFYPNFVRKPQLLNIMATNNNHNIINFYGISILQQRHTLDWKIKNKDITCGLCYEENIVHKDLVNAPLEEFSELYFNDFVAFIPSATTFEINNPVYWWTNSSTTLVYFQLALMCPTIVSDFSERRTNYTFEDFLIQEVIIMMLNEAENIKEIVRLFLTSDGREILSKGFINYVFKVPDKLEANEKNLILIRSFIARCLCLDIISLESQVILHLYQPIFSRESFP